MKVTWTTEWWKSFKIGLAI